MNRKVSWKQRRSEALITLCRNCQKWEHVALHCKQLSKCAKCAQYHTTNECTKNCSKNHPADYRGCVAYTQALQSRGMQPPMTRVSSRRPSTRPLGGQGGSATRWSETHKSPEESQDLEEGADGPPPSQEIHNAPQIMEVLREIRNILISNAQIVSQIYEIFTQILQRSAPPSGACRNGGFIHNGPCTALGRRAQGWERLTGKTSISYSKLISN
ncbi:hypothetical protein JTB14_031087 [Gonioctena quinquepunctata]|nr:hypothetical protein JTB14_031087 [Gonioctena quinquepunctata]